MSNSHMLNIDNLTTDAGFGFEYYLELINSSDLDAWEDIQILVKYKGKDELKTMKASKDAVEEAALVKRKNRDFLLMLVNLL